MLLSYITCVCHYIFFFFSSRRRHTRFKCDWSSDVCSSDLALLRRLPQQPGVRAACARGRGPGGRVAPRAVRHERRRSGERRVGEEGRSRWAPYHLKKKKKKVADRLTATVQNVRDVREHARP